jgi:hypothetical protein
MSSGSQVLKSTTSHVSIFPPPQNIFHYHSVSTSLIKDVKINTVYAILNI